MAARMLHSQLATLEDPSGETGVASVEIDAPEEKVKKEAVEAIRTVVAVEVEESQE